MSARGAKRFTKESWSRLVSKGRGVTLITPLSKLDKLFCPRSDVYEIKYWNVPLVAVTLAEDAVTYHIANSIVALVERSISRGKDQQGSQLCQQYGRS